MVSALNSRAITRPLTKMSFTMKIIIIMRYFNIQSALEANTCEQKVTNNFYFNICSIMFIFLK